MFFFFFDRDFISMYGGLTERIKVAGGEGASSTPAKQMEGKVRSLMMRCCVVATFSLSL